MSKKIIFLDIDGPVIDLETYDSNIYKSIFRTGINPVAIEFLIKLCKEYDAQIVTNSMHNYHNINNYTLKDDLVYAGITDDFFHQDWRTIFPMIDYTNVKSSVRGIGRLIAIQEWLKRNGKHTWICFDDRKFTKDRRLIHIKRQNGIDFEYYSEARHLLSDKKNYKIYR